MTSLVSQCPGCDYKLTQQPSFDNDYYVHHRYHDVQIPTEGNSCMAYQALNDRSQITNQQCVGYF